jgi:D-amino peptidase
MADVGGLMRVLISADMEGTTGATGWKDVEPGQPAFERFRRLLTRDVNAAVQGAFDGGATDVLVNEAHDGMRNILIEELDQRAEMISGLHKPLVMMAGVEECDVVFFVGYHARAGLPGVLAHTMTGDFVSVELNGEPASEARLNATLAGQRGIPVGLVTGDDVICAEAEKLFAGVKTAVVKYAIDNFSARCLTPERSGERIHEAARLALVERDGLRPYVVEPPFTIHVTLKEPAQAGAAANVPGVLREGPTTVVFTSDNYYEAYGALEAIGSIAGTVQ